MMLINQLDCSQQQKLKTTINEPENFQKNPNFQQIPKQIESFTECIEYEYNKSGLHQDSICWSIDGSQVIIKNKEELGRAVLPLYYKTRKVTTFIRQLNLFSFQHSKDDLNNHIYYNPQFNRDEGNSYLTKKQQIRQNLKQEHQSLESEVQNLLKFFDTYDQQDFQDLIEIHKGMCMTKQMMHRKAIRDRVIETFLIRNLISLGRGVELKGFGNNIFQATIQFIDALLENNDSYQEDFSAQIFANSI